MNNPENGFGKNKIYEVSVVDEHTQNLLLHLGKQLQFLKKEEVTLIGDWEEVTNEDLGFTIRQRVGTVDDVFNLKGEKIRVIIIFRQKAISKEGKDLSFDATAEMKKIEDTFEASALPPIMMDSVLNLDEKYLPRQDNLAVIVVPPYKWILEEEN